MYTIKPIARVRSDYKEKFGIPRQPGLVPSLRSKIVFEPEFRNVDAVRGVEDYSYIWIIWGFSETRIDMTADAIDWSPTVRPPRLGGKVRKGVWATRSPYRPNSLGLSSVKIEKVTLEGPYGPEIIVSGADILDGTPVYDIKPYVPFSDSHPDADESFSGDKGDVERLKVVFPEDLIKLIDEDKRDAIAEILSLDPRGAYEKQPGYRYGLSFADVDIKFTVSGDILTVVGVESITLCLSADS